MGIIANVLSQRSMLEIRWQMQTDQKDKGWVGQEISSDSAWMTRAKLEEMFEKREELNKKKDERAVESTEEAQRYGMTWKGFFKHF